jgi:hypothetical protein
MCAGSFALVHNMLLTPTPMDVDALYERSPSLANAENWLVLGTGALLLVVGASRRSVVGASLAMSSAPLLYLGINGRWPDVPDGHVQPDSTRESPIALASKMRRRCTARFATNTIRASRSV